MHGYDLIRTLEERSGGMWRPSPGSIYPTLQMLEEEGLISGEDRDGKRVYSITDDGRAELEKRKEQAGAAGAPWEGGNEMMRALRESVAGLAAAAMQVGRAGSVEQVTKTTAILAEARKKVYALLAES
jgi:DNA-binding PadR family transcriptional regulator